MSKRGIIFILSAPSGGGKTTLLRMVEEKVSDLADSVSYTTRPRRPTERDGVDYHFLDEQDFLARRDNGFFAEWARVHDVFYYGTSRADLEAIIEGGKDAIMDIDVQGARQLKSAFPEAVTIFILPPSIRDLEKRLRRRATEDEEAIERRLRTALREMELFPSYDYLIINRDLATAVAELAAIITAERIRTSRFDQGELRRGIQGWDREG